MAKGNDMTWLWILGGVGLLGAVALAAKKRAPIRRGTKLFVEKGQAIIEDAPEELQEARTAVREKIVEKPREAIEKATEAVEETVSKWKNSAASWLSKTKIPQSVLDRATKELGLSERAFLAIAAVESEGKTGAIRFECDDFNKELGRDAVPCTVEAGEDYSTEGSETNEAAMWVAYKVNKDLALKHSSWGPFQVKNPVGLGMASTPDEWVNRWNTEDRWALCGELLIAWFKDWRAALNDAKAAEAAGGSAEDWRPFVAKYNGSNYWKHEYHERMAEAYRQA